GGNGVCVGMPIDGVDVMIRPVDDRGRATAEPTATPGTLGEVVVRAAHARVGYDRLWHTQWAADQPEGWHATGDLGQLDRDGRLWIGGRGEHVITTADGPLAPVRLEQLAELVDGVARACVVGVGPVGLQQIVVVLELDHAVPSPRVAGTASSDRVRALVDVPVVAVIEVPRLPDDRRHNSKIDRTAVARWAARSLADGTLPSL
ncbi:MAG: AMP-ligase, partial [Ilumatobacteraceae bacterium]